MKTCCKCKKSKKEKEFNKNISKKDGLSTECRLCVKNYKKEYYIKNKDNLLKKMKQWTKDNPKKSKLKNKKYYENNKEKIKERSIIWNKDNKDKKASTGKIYYKNNKQKLKEKNVKWRKNNPERYKEIQRRWAYKNNYGKFAELAMLNNELEKLIKKEKENA
jgi:hypothetical protein